MPKFIDLGPCDIIRETDAALLVEFGDGQEEWFPRSQVENGDSYQEGDQPEEFMITKWIADQKEIDEP